VTGDDVAKAKPSPDVFVMAAERLNVPIDHCVVIGDSVALIGLRGLTNDSRRVLLRDCELNRQ